MECEDCRESHVSLKTKMHLYYVLPVVLSDAELLLDKFQLLVQQKFPLQPSHSLFHLRLHVHLRQNPHTSRIVSWAVRTPAPLGWKSGAQVYLQSRSLQVALGNLED